MKTQEEIVDRIRETMTVMGFEREMLFKALDFEHAEEFLKPGVTEEVWPCGLASDKDVKEAMLDYMPFAWEKANNCRGISAYRSMCHYRNWLWLLGVDDIDVMDYEYYGKPELVKICERFDWDHAQWDDGVRKNEE